MDQCLRALWTQKFSGNAVSFWKSLRMIIPFLKYYFQMNLTNSCQANPLYLSNWLKKTSTFIGTYLSCISMLSCRKKVLLAYRNDLPFINQKLRNFVKWIRLMTLLLIFWQTIRGQIPIRRVLVKKQRIQLLSSNKFQRLQWMMEMARKLMLRSLKMMTRMQRHHISNNGFKQCSLKTTCSASF